MSGGVRGVGPVLLLVAAVVVSIVVPLALTEAPQDDAYITYVYARNFARGEGLVFNAGEEPVEGYTNFLWTLILGLAMKAGADPERLAPALGVACTAGTTVLTAALAASLGAGPWLAALAAVLFATRPALTVHAAGGLETPFFTLLLVLGLHFAVRRPRGSRDDVAQGVALAAAALARPEGLLVFGLLELPEALRWLGRRVAAADYFPGVLRRALPFAAITGAHLAWRLHFYGDWVPNTFHAKVSPGPAVWAAGWQYCLDAVVQFGPVAFLLPFVAAWRAGRPRAWIACLLVSAAFTAYVASVGGDYVPRSRYLVPVMPVWCALAAAAFGLTAGWFRSRATRVAVLGVLVGLSALSTARDARRDTGWGDQAERHRQLVAAGTMMNRILAPDAWIAVTNAGRLPYFADRRTIDMMGLSDKHIARTRTRGIFSKLQVGHLKGDGRYVLDREPEAIAMLRLVALDRPLAADEDWPQTVRHDAFSWSEIQIAKDPRLRAEYRLLSVPLGDGNGWLNLHVRADAVVDRPDGTLEASP